MLGRGEKNLSLEQLAVDFLILLYSLQGLSKGQPGTPHAGLMRLKDAHLGGGRLEYYRNHEWTSVCMSGFNELAADLACHQLGFLHANKFLRANIFGHSVGTSSSITQIICSSKISSLGGCSIYSCYEGHSEDVALVCTNKQTPSRLSSETGQTQKLSSGRLELLVNDKWGTVCNNSFSKIEADVACKQLGYERSNSYTAAASIGFAMASASTPVWLEKLDCSSRSRTSDLRLCQHNGVGNTHCSHASDVILSCAYPGSLRLSHSPENETKLERYGRLEVYWNGKWGAVCNKENFTRAPAEVACKQLGFNGVECHGTSEQLGLKFSKPLNFFLDDVFCSSADMKYLSECSSSKLGSTHHHCSFASDDVALSCSSLSGDGHHELCGGQIGVAGLISAVLVTLAIIACCAATVVVSFKKKLYHRPHVHVNRHAVGIAAMVTTGAAPAPPPPPSTMFTNQSVPNSRQFPDAAYPRQQPMAPPMPENHGNDYQYTDPNHYQFQLNAGPVLHECPPPSYDVAMDHPPFALGQIPPASMASTASNEKRNEASF